MKLQYQLSNGNWVNCNGGYDGNQRDRTEEFLVKCENTKQIVDNELVIITRDEIVAILATGKTVRNHSEDWYSNCRDGEAIERITEARRAAATPIEMKKCSCGHTIPKNLVMSASTGSSCPDCYDRMSE